MSKRKKKETLVYCGPSVKGLNQYDVFTNGLPAKVKNYYENKVFKELFVSITAFPVVKSDIQRQGSRENQLYYKALSIAEEVSE